MAYASHSAVSWWHDNLSINQQRAWMAAECTELEERNFSIAKHQAGELLLRMHAAYKQRNEYGEEYYRLAYVEYVRRHHFRYSFMDFAFFKSIMLQ